MQKNFVVVEVELPSSIGHFGHYLKDSKYKNSTVHPSPGNFVFLMEGKIKVTEFIWE